MNTIRRTLTVLIFCAVGFSSHAQWSDTGTSTPIYRSGNVGIGVSGSPSETLLVGGTIGIFGPGLNGTTYQRTVIYSDTNYGLLLEAPLNSANVKQDIQFNWRGGGTPPFFIKGATGRVGIGTSSPDYDFQVHSGNMPVIGIGKINTNTNGRSSLAFAAGDGSASGTFSVNYNKTATTDRLSFVDGSGLERVSIMNDGKVGIGLAAPAYPLDVQGSGARVRNLSTAQDAYTTYRIQGPDYSQGLEIDFFGNNNITSDLNWSYGGGAGSAAIVNVNAKPLTFGTSNQGRMIIDAAGNVGIGTFAPDKKLTVKGTIHTNEVQVDMSAPIQGPDYVFEKDYDLLPLGELERYINQHKHLPEVPSAKEMEADGLNLKEMNLLLLKKVEELTLHVIRIDHENQELKKQLSSITKK